jgi:asparagine synthase (glutamine-hydrolysing)
MCGIAGILDRDHRDPGARVPAMLDVQAHRGPDGSGVWTDAEAGDEATDPEKAFVALGHRRLSILDLSANGAQPMHWAGRYTITYNGEVYDYLELRAELETAHGVRFHTECDTEVLLAAYAVWGEDCLHRLNGMFAFAIYDRDERSLFLARDRLGVKPLSWTWDGRRFGFASEVKALLAAGLAPGTPDPDAIYEYLASGITTEGRSFHEGVNVLPPGHCMRIGADGPLEVREWWTPSREADPSRTYADWAEEVAATLDDAVRLRLRSDVPVGAHLSGGMDSSAVVAAAARHGGADVHTFTGAFLGDARSDEREYSRAVNACRVASEARRPASATTAEESTPPLSEVPTGTSERSRSRIESTSSSRSPATASG